MNAVPAAFLPVTARSSNASTFDLATSRPGPLPHRPGVDMARLIGRPHLFARYKDLRDGFVLEPIGTMTLQPDGGITGYRHANEGSWIRYEHSEVDASQAFAFVTAHNHWIPSSTWATSAGDMPIGHFCDEPEAQSGLQKLCLVPADEHPRPAHVVYLIASCVPFYQRTVPALLTQLLGEGIEKSRIKVVVNGASRDYDEQIDGVDHAFTTHNAWEWSALYEAPRRWDFEYAFLIHDTNVIFPGFRRSVETFNRHIHWDHLPASPLARCLLGSYSHDFLTRLNPWLRSIDRISKRDGVIAEASGELLLRARSALIMGDPDADGGARAAEWRELVDHFNTGSPRVRRSFPAIKLDKFIHAGPTNPERL